MGFPVEARRGQRVVVASTARTLLSHSLRPLRRDQSSRGESSGLLGTPSSKKDDRPGSCSLLCTKARISMSQSSRILLEKPAEIALAIEMRDSADMTSRRTQKKHSCLFSNKTVPY
ncbi:uncharacterized protein LOC112552982 [Pogonomyrmex barbatus]|uniref:Uncharacterized protein LOC112552982 n=1 Tax=Pogonomyrmex barbatus TaxID=144034 RepID=A0A8N1S9P3_9HYME|nr:uncharacterized protein LOC112552982 [Pogonomyrmex barbatus]